MAHVQLVAVAAATFAAFMAGGVWYGPLFGKAWQAELGMTDAAWAGANKVTLFALSLACEGVVAIVFSLLLGHIAHRAGVTMLVAIGIAIGIITPALAMNYRFALKSWTLVAIDAGHWMLVLVVMGAVFAVLQI